MSQYKLLSLIMLATFIAAPIVTLAHDQSSDRSAGQYIDDNFIAGEVKANILGEAGMKGFDVTVTVYKGTVQLSGFVDNQAQKDRAGEIAASANGVTAVSNNLIVR